MYLRTFIVFASALALAACGGTGATTTGSGRTPAVKSAPRPPAPRNTAPTPVLRSAPGLENVIGAGADQLIRQFGKPRLDILEGDARKLQWTATACILDAYLYPLQQGQQPVATHVDARRGDGRDVDKAACVAALRQR
jgi:hypothetical protein